MPGQAVFIDLPEIDDLDRGERVLPIDAERVIVRQPRKCVTPPGRVAQPADDGSERQDRGPRLERRPLDAPDRCLRETSSRARRRINQTSQGNGQDRARPVARGTMVEKIGHTRRRESPLQHLDLLERQSQRNQHRTRS